MFDAKVSEDGQVVLRGRFDASQVDKAKSVFDRVTTTCAVDFGGLEYISSAGLSVLLLTQKRLGQTGHCLKLRNLNPHIRQIFEYARFDVIFNIE